MLRLAVFALMGVMLTLPLRADPALRVTTTGSAFVHGPADRDAARLRALGAALVHAAMAGGAELRATSAMSNARITHDLTILRAAGRVISHRITGEELTAAGEWRVQIDARVAPPAPAQCSGRRRLTLALRPASVTLRPEAPAWVAQTAAEAEAMIRMTLLRHRDMGELRDLPAARATGARGTAGMDYVTLVQGGAVAARSEDILSPQIAISAAGGRIILDIEMAREGPDGQAGRFRYAADAPLPATAPLGILGGANRSAGQERLLRGLEAALDDWITDLACQAPVARLAWGNGALTAPLGQRQGLSRGALAVIDDPNDSFGLLVIRDLGADHVTLTPLDPTRAAQSLAGRQVYFIEAGL